MGNMHKNGGGFLCKKRMGNMYKNGGCFLCKIDSVKRFPLHPHGKSVAAIFRRDDAEDNEIDKGAEEAEKTGDFGAFWCGRSLAGLRFAGLFGWGLFGGFSSVSFIKKSEQIGVKTRVLVVHFATPLRMCRSYRRWLFRGTL